MDGNLDEIIDALATHEQAEKLRQLNAQAEEYCDEKNNVFAWN